MGGPFEGRLVIARLGGGRFTCAVIWSTKMGPTGNLGTK